MRAEVAVATDASIIAVAAWKPHRAPVAAELVAPACEPQRETFGKARHDVLELYVGGSKARSSGSMLVPCEFFCYLRPRHSDACADT